MNENEGMIEQPIQQVMAELNGGNTMRELSREMKKLVKAVEDTGKVGELTLKIKMRPVARGNSSTLILEDLITVKTPQADRAQTVFFSVGNGKLQRNDPNQMEMGDLRSVDKEEKTELRQVS